MDDLISRQAAIDEAKKLLDYYGTNDITKEFADLAAEQFMNRVPYAQPEDWMERNKERILQAGMEGREVEFYIGGRLFAIREIAQ